MGNKKILYRSLSCISLIFVIAFGIIVIVASGGGGDGGTSNPNIEKCATPVFSPGTGSFVSDQYISISTSTKGANIFYTTDNSEPSTLSNVYTTSVLVRGNGAI
jgi:hypothetical protein